MADDPQTNEPDDGDGKALSQYPILTDQAHNVAMIIVAALAAKGLLAGDNIQAGAGLVAALLISALSSVHVHGYWARLLGMIQGLRHK